MNDTVVSVENIDVLYSPKEYKQRLLALIAGAKTRIFITALYLQDDDAGREVLHALYQAKTKNPEIEVKVFVDYHRAQRGLIGEKDSLGNRALYLELEKTYSVSIDIYGVAVKSREMFGVLHLKGMVFDDQVFYTGASINDIYCHEHDRYRLDRYYQISSLPLANSFCSYLIKNFLDTEIAPRLNGEQLPDKNEQKRIIQYFKLWVKKAKYHVSNKHLQSTPLLSKQNNITITPLVGCGSRNNRLNKAIRHMVQNAETEILLLTPYFNLPKLLARDVNKALRRGVKITLIIGDKTANDFYIPPEKNFSTIGIVPYLYEVLLSRYIKKQKKFIDQGLLNIRLWKDASNSFHLKGMVVDNRHHLITGSNLNPRAWSLDLENGLLLDDPQQQLMPVFEKEWASLVEFTQLITHTGQIDQIDSYPEKPRNLLKKLRMVQIDRLLKRLL